MGSGWAFRAGSILIDQTVEQKLVAQMDIVSPALMTGAVISAVADSENFLRKLKTFTFFVLQRWYAP